MAAAAASFEDDETKFWEMRKLVKKLDSYKGNGTSMISLYMPQNQQI